MFNMMMNFKLFGVSHILLLILSIALVVCLFILFRKYFGDSRKILSIILISVAGVFAVLDLVGRLVVGGKFFESLPVAPWQVFIYIGIFVEITKRESWIKFGYLITIPLCVLGFFVVPNYYSSLGMFSLPLISYFLGSATITLYSLLQMIWSDAYLYKKDIVNVSFNYVIIISFAHIFNIIMRFTTLAVHANYFGTVGEEYDVIMKLLNGWISIPFIHLLPLFAVIVGLEFLMMLPYELKTRRTAQQEHIEELVALGNLKAQQDARKASSKGGSQILVKGENKAQPKVQKNVNGSMNKNGFVSVTKTVQTHNDDSNK